MNAIKSISFELITDKYKTKLTFLIVVNKKCPK